VKSTRMGSPLPSQTDNLKVEHGMPDAEVKATSMRTKQLSLYPNSEDKERSEEEQIILFELKFQQNGYKVDVSPPDNSLGSFTVEFENIMTAQKALRDAKKIGYVLKPKKFKRPTPNTPFKFEVLSELTVRSGRTFKAEIVDMKKKGDVVLVNRTKGRRARLCIKENGISRNLGWVSLFSSRGYPFLLQLEGY